MCHCLDDREGCVGSLRCRSQAANRKGIADCGPGSRCGACVPLRRRTPSSGSTRSSRAGTPPRWVTRYGRAYGLDADQQSMRLFVNGTSSTDLDDSARAILTGVPPTPPAQPPSFFFKVVNRRASGGFGPARHPVRRRRRRRVAVVLQAGQWSFITARRAMGMRGGMLADTADADGDLRLPSRRTGDRRGAHRRQRRGSTRGSSPVRTWTTSATAARPSASRCPVVWWTSRST